MSDFPWIIVRISCHVCRRRGSYRLARLAEGYGAETDLADVLKGISADCPYRTVKFRNAGGCKAYFLDLGAPSEPPPDLPPRMKGPHLIWVRQERDEEEEAPQLEQARRRINS